jgi:IS5 family transposase
MSANWARSSGLTLTRRRRVVAMKHGVRNALDRTTTMGRVRDRFEEVTSSVQAKVEQSFRVIKHPLGQVKFRNCAQTNSTAQLKTLLALFNLWMAREKLCVLVRIARPANQVVI